MEYPISATVHVEGPRIQVYRFLALCKTIEYLCQVGSTRTVSIDVDGDGAGNIKFGIDPAWDEFINQVPVNTDRDPVRVPGINDY